jgi:hypothetical protein
MKLIGKKYPVTNIETNKIVGYKFIKHEFHASNSAQVMIFLTNDLFNPLTTGILLDYNRAREIESESEQYPNFNLDSEEDRNKLKEILKNQ